jgi:RpiR family transcriptional regulator, carbohydrate utilization regulator
MVCLSGHVNRARSLQARGCRRDGVDGHTHAPVRSGRAGAPDSRDESLSPPALRGGVLPRLRAALPSLQPSEARVARSILDDPEAVIHRSVTEVAETAGSSPSTVVRCAQKVGFRGFHELKLALAQELAAFDRAGPTRPMQDGDAMSVLADVTAAGARTITEAAAVIDPDELAAAVSLLDGARRILVVGAGTSAPLAQDAGYRFRMIGLPTESPGDGHVQHLAARTLRAGDVCLAISHSGSTRETCAAVGSAVHAGASTIALTSFLNSPLTDLADVRLVAGTREVSFRLEAMASRLAHMAVLDALLVAVAMRDQTRAQAALDLYADVLAEHTY